MKKTIKNIKFSFKLIYFMFCDLLDYRNYRS